MQEKGQADDDRSRGEKSRPLGGREIDNSHDRRERARSSSNPGAILRAGTAPHDARAPSFLFVRPRNYIYPKRARFFSPYARPHRRRRRAPLPLCLLLSPDRPLLPASVRTAPPGTGNPRRSAQLKSQSTTERGLHPAWLISFARLFLSPCRRYRRYLM